MTVRMALTEEICFTSPTLKAGWGIPFHGRGKGLKGLDRSLAGGTAGSAGALRSDPPGSGFRHITAASGRELLRAAPELHSDCKVCRAFQTCLSLLLPLQEVLT